MSYRPDIDAVVVTDMYTEGQSLEEIAGALGTSRWTIKQRVLSQGVEIKAPHVARKPGGYFIVKGAVLVPLWGHRSVLKSWTLVDLSESECLGQFRWALSHSGYAVRTKVGKLFGMGREILKPPNHLQVDHINRNKLDNRRCNLRAVTSSENCKNKVSRRGVLKDYVQEIRERAELGETHEQLACEFGVSTSSITSVVCQKTYKSRS